MGCPAVTGLAPRPARPCLAGGISGSAGAGSAAPAASKAAAIAVWPLMGLLAGGGDDALTGVAARATAPDAGGP